MAKSDAARGPIAAWMRRERRARGWSDERMAQELAKRGANILPASYRGYEAGPRPPSATVIKALEAVFGSSAPDPETEKERAGDLPALIEALRDQTAAMNDLVAALRGQRPSVDPAELVSSLAAALAQHFRPRSEEDAHESGDPPEQDTAPSPQPLTTGQ